jgi:hypothetical protein
LFCAVASILTFRATKSKDRCNSHAICNKRLRGKNAVEYKNFYLLSILPLFVVAISKGSIFYMAVFICTFCADRKYQRALRMDAFLTKNVVDILWASGTRLAAQNGSAIFLT